MIVVFFMPINMVSTTSLSPVYDWVFAPLGCLNYNGRLMMILNLTCTIHWGVLIKNVWRFLVWHYLKVSATDGAPMVILRLHIIRFNAVVVIEFIGNPLRDRYVLERSHWSVVLVPIVTIEDQFLLAHIGLHILILLLRLFLCFFLKVNLYRFQMALWYYLLILLQRWCLLSTIYHDGNVNYLLFNVYGKIVFFLLNLTTRVRNHSSRCERHGSLYPWMKDFSRTECLGA